MCGIFGIWNRDGRPVDLCALERATTSLRHRGPDDEGYLLVDTRSGRTVLCSGEETTKALALPNLHSFQGQTFDLGFGFRRLAILDLSPAGHQPMRGPTDKTWIVFNGEIYNHVELRQQLQGLGYSFRSGSDTEVILAAYERWGEAAVEKLRGMWAFALWDQRRQSLLVSRDRFGIKPLHLTTTGATLAFSSEIKAIGAGGVLALEADAAVVSQFIATGQMPVGSSGETFFRGVHSHLPAHTTIHSREAAAMFRYWEIPAPATSIGRSQEVIERYQALFQDSIRKHLRADVPIGTCLSGGLDSSSIVSSVAAAKREMGGPQLQSFSAVYPGEGPWNERPFIERVVAHTGVTPHYVEPSSADLVKNLAALMRHQEEPVPTTSIFAQWCVMRLARQNGLTVMLDGQGADELLAGYHTYYADHLRDVLRKRGVVAAARAAREMADVVEGTAASTWFKESARVLLGPVSRPLAARRQERFLRQSAAAAALRDDIGIDAVREWMGDASERGLAEALRYSTRERSMPDLLRFEDRNSMAFSIEARVPFLDHPLVEYVWSNAHDYRIHNGWTKWLHREAAKNELPAEVVWRRDKVGFATPQHEWIPDIADQVIPLFEDGSPVEVFLDVNKVRAKLIDRTYVRKSGELVWRWISLASWCDELLHNTRADVVRPIARGREKTA